MAYTYEDVGESAGKKVPLTREEKEAIAIEWNENDAKHKATQWERDRESTYPSWQDQFDQIYHEGIDAWKASVKKIKDDNPKP